MSRQTDRRTPVVGPAILITIGVLALIQNFGQLPANFWTTLWRLWPLVLVLVGVEILISQLRLPWAASFLLALLVIAASITGVVYVATNAPLAVERGPREVRQVATELQGATSARVRLEFGAGDLRVGATSGGNIMQGDFSEAGGQRSEVGYSASGGQGDLRLTIAGRGGPFITSSNRNSWDVRLNDSIPLDLRVEAGLSTSTLDLTRLKLSALRVEAGLSTTQVNLPAAGDYRAHISCGLSTTTITIPQGMAARINVKSGLSSLSVDETRFHRSGDTYTSPGYETAANRVDLTVEGGMATISVR